MPIWHGKSKENGENRERGRTALIEAKVLGLKRSSVRVASKVQPVAD